MSKKELLDILNETSSIEKLLTPSGDNFMLELKTIYRNKDFLKWKERLKLQLQEVDQTPLVVEILQLLDDRFKTGLSDEKDFLDLQSKLEVLSESLDKYFEDEVKVTSYKLKKGTIVKTAFDEYTVIEQVGSGGNGRVFSATNKDGVNVAIKFVEKNISHEKLKRFKNEIHFCEHHDHPNLVKIKDRGYVFLDEKDYVFYVMPLYAETLKNKIKNGVSHDKILDIFIGLLEGLKYAHEHGSIHRDIKPDNIMFEINSYVPVICDFGIAHFIDEEELTTVETKPGSRMANFQFAAPEQKISGGNICPQTDIYALGLILNEMFTGEIPQAAGYKKIADINPEYKYLDDLFDLLFKQKPEERLYPETSILSELKLLTEQYKRDKEKERLKSVVNELVVPEDFNPLLIDLEFKNNNIQFVFDSVLPDDWFRYLANGSYNCSWQMGYEHSRLKKIDKNTIAMPIRGDERDDTIKTLVENVKNWVATVSSEYSRAAKMQAVAEQKRKEEARLAEINRIEKENKMNSTLNSLLKDLL